MKCFFVFQAREIGMNIAQQGLLESCKDEEVSKSIVELANFLNKPVSTGRKWNDLTESFVIICFTRLDLPTIISLIIDWKSVPNIANFFQIEKSNWLCETKNQLQITYPSNARLYTYFVHYVTWDCVIPNDILSFIFELCMIVECDQFISNVDICIWLIDRKINE